MSPDELIYAQPVDIKPVGQPIPSIQIRGPPRAYGAPKPVAMYSHRPGQKIPPKRMGYGGPPRPGFSEKYGHVSGANYQQQYTQGNGLYNTFNGGNENNFVSKPPTYGSESPYLFENNNRPSFNKVPQPSLGSHSAKPDSTVQQHVHHHYVHDTGDKDPKVIIKPVAIPVGSVGSINTQSLSHQQPEIITAGGADFSSFGNGNGGFKPMTGAYSPDRKPINTETIYGSQYGQNIFNKESGNFGHQSLPGPHSPNAFDDQKYGNSLGSYASNTDFYKKELNVGSGSNNLYGQGPATFGSNNEYENYHEAKAQGLECVCVNYDQCPSQEIIGRRDDLYLPIDPRNKGSEISALTEEQLDNVTASETQDDTAKIDKQTNSTEAETKKVAKRETKSEEKSDDSTKEIEPVST